MMISSIANNSSNGRVAVCTGANKGIGYYIALQLSLSGMFQHIILACRDSGRAAEAVSSIQAQLSNSNSVQVHAAPLIIGDSDSHAAFAKTMQDTFGKVDCVVNNAGFAYKSADPTPFKGQCKKTLDINYRGTIDFTEKMLPLLRKGTDPRLVNVASTAGRLSQVSPELQAKFSSPTLTLPELNELVHDFEDSVQNGTHTQKGYSNSNYGMSKLALIAATKIMARENPDMAINCCCPGYCKTDMTSQMGHRDPADGARNAVMPATMEHPPTGAFFRDYKPSEW